MDTSPSQRILIHLQGGDEKTAKVAFNEFGLTIQFTHGHRYLGEIQPIIETWVRMMEIMSKVKVKYPQFYAGFTFSLIKMSDNSPCVF